MKESFSGIWQLKPTTSDLGSAEIYAIHQPALLHRRLLESSSQSSLCNASASSAESEQQQRYQEGMQSYT